MIVLIDNYDSFTFNLVHYLGGLGADVAVHRNDKISVADVIAAATGRMISGADRDVPMTAFLHAVHATVGWRFLFVEDHLLLRIELGWTHTVASQFEIGETDPSGRFAAAIEGAEAYLEDLVETYAFTPTLGVTLGYRLF